MLLCQNKKGLTMQMLVFWLFLLASGVIIGGLIIQGFAKAPDSAAEELCRGTVAARAKLEVDIDTPGPNIQAKPAPLLCRTLDKEAGGKEKTKDETVKEVADMAARTWRMYGDGLVKDVFEEGTAGGADECQIGFSVTVDKWKDYEEGDSIPIADVIDYMYETPYIVNRIDDVCKNNGGFCVRDKGECDEKGEKWRYDENNVVCDELEEHKKSCCYIKSECENKGGSCKGECGDGEIGYDGYFCEQEDKCCIEKQEVFTYMDYIQQYRGEGAFLAVTDSIRPNEIYAFAYGSPTDNCGTWCSVLVPVGTTIGIGAAIVFTAGGATPIIIGSVAGATAGAFAGSSWADFVAERSINTIYLAKQSDISKYCVVVDDISGD